MSRVTFEISMSLDGFITGPDPGPGQLMGDGGDQLHRWMFDAATETDAGVLDEWRNGSGALLMGMRMFEAGVGPWGDDPPFHRPVFVLTHQDRDPLVKRGGTSYTFVTGGITAALQRARRAAGGKNVAVAGGANLFRQYLTAGLLDELQIHLVPVLLGGGIRLFGPDRARGIALQPLRVLQSCAVTHLTYRVMR